MLYKLILVALVFTWPVLSQIYTQPFTSSTRITMLGATHGQGVQIAPGECWDNLNPQRKIVQLAGYPRRASNGDVSWSWSGARTGNCYAVGPAGGGGGSAVWGAITGVLSGQADLQSALNLKAPLVAGVVPTVNLGSGTASGTTFLRGDNTWAVPAGGGAGGGAWGTITGTLSDQTDLQTALNLKAPLVGGLVPTANLGGGSASGTTFLRGDGTWATPAGGSGGGALEDLTDVDLNDPILNRHTLFFNSTAGMFENRYIDTTDIVTGGPFIATRLGSGAATAGFALISSGLTTAPVWQSITGTGGTVTNIATGCGTIGGPITTTGTIAARIAVGSSIVLPYTILATDCGRLLSFNAAAGGVLTLPVVDATFPAGWYVWLHNRGTVGDITLTPAATALLDASASPVTLLPGQGLLIASNAVQWFSMRGMGTSGGGGGGGVGVTVLANLAAYDGTCTVGEIYYVTDQPITKREYYCSATNVISRTSGIASGAIGGLDCETTDGVCDIVPAVVPTKTSANTMAGRNTYSQAIGLTPAAAPGAPTNGDLWYETGTNKFKGYENGAIVDMRGGGGAAVWGTITGTLSSQTDLQTALTAKAPLVSGVVPTANLGSGSASGTTFLRGDATWAAPAGGSTTTVFAAFTTAPLASSTTHNSIGGTNAAWNSSSNLKQTGMNAAGTFSKMKLRTSADQHNTGAMTCSMFVNGSAPVNTLAVTLAISDTGRLFTDNTHTVTVAEGDLVTWTCNNAATAAGAVIASIVVDFTKL